MKIVLSRKQSHLYMSHHHDVFLCVFKVSLVATYIDIDCGFTKYFGVIILIWVNGLRARSMQPGYTASFTQNQGNNLSIIKKI